MDKIKIQDPESYNFLITQKEILFDILHDMVNSYEMFGYKNYKDEDEFECLNNNLIKLHSTLEFFDKVKHTASEILRLSDILGTIQLSNLTEAQLESFDILEFLINDIKQYILDMFIEENVQDINYFHDSLQDNITTFENALNSEEDDEDDEIEFL